MSKRTQKISVIGDGAWGTTLAIYLARLGHPVTLWGAFPGNIRSIQRNNVNARFLPGIVFPKNITATHDLSEAIDTADIILLASPSQYVTDVLKKIKVCQYKDKPFLSVVKGIDNTSLLRISQIITKKLGRVPLAVLSGPTIAMEVAQGLPSTAVIASKDIKLAKSLQRIINSDTFRIYTNTDVVGIELGGSLKNIIAIACGVCDGLGYGTNTKAAILSRGLVEMSRLGMAMGAKNKTFAGLAGLGDLVTTCVSPQSRNRHVGEQLGKGRSIKTILGSMSAVAEGVETVKAVHKLCLKYKVAMPISQEVYNIIWKGKKPHKAVTDLMTRKIRSE